MVKAEQVQHRGVKIRHVHLVAHHAVTPLVGLAIDEPLLHAAAGHPDRERLVVMIAPLALRLIDVLIRVHGGRATEFTAPDDQRVFEHPALFQIREQRADGLVHFLRGTLHAALDLAVVVPRILPDLHETHPALDEPPRDKNLPRLRALAIHRADSRRLAADVEGVRRFHLHPIRDLEGLNARFKLRLLLTLRGVLGVQLREQVQLPPLFRERGVRALDVLNQLIDLLLVGVHVGALEHAGQKRALPVLLTLQGPPRRHAHERGQILILRSQPVSRPRAEARTDEPVAAGVDEHHRVLVARRGRVGRANHRHLINVLGDVREDVAHLDAALPVLLKLERRAKNRAAERRFLPHVLDDLAVVLREVRLRVKRVHMRRPALRENVNDALGLGREMRHARRERRAEIHGGGMRSTRKRVLHQRRQTQCAETEAAAGKKLTARLKRVLKTWCVVAHNFRAWNEKMDGAQHGRFTKVSPFHRLQEAPPAGQPSREDRGAQCWDGKNAQARRSAYRGPGLQIWKSNSLGRRSAKLGMEEGSARRASGTATAVVCTASHCFSASSRT